ncbi:UDP-N-acetylglucosamine 1-carboxyvinyltransferase [Mediterraneibacter glycyrrhizinilyticus]|uniref:UDP-N-acetylglucosamine 1-carboxyvinyltransferase n=1 Tax=Mediterraneibacter glycyrrhizinilyticus TaxID=342942 RepID=UPI001D074C33|nr:UDP-N-acetylglucosamine 1-carboxyvinyltransferase [Mediterraneibacter glycyrrhizinilyticus]MCB6307913.1 UDP-N-acetylglucosamine 1-carboxyvinyltransferase [Lachnospiraceae bacterium 210521-DFI.1.109]MCB6425738.1 UDP-N-acetylglucosamine 1-carboxyvinyltransferase [Mediterraneibacter glycyrrhizinilyticus]
MEQYIIKGGNPLVGEVEIGGAKNAALAILAAAIMTDETVQIENLPDVNDINVMLEAIAGIGAMVQRIDRHTVKINGSTIGDFNIEYDYIKKIRASYYLLGALLGKYKRAEVALPGGCNIGSRPIDQHLKGFRALGADVDIEHGKIVAEAEQLRGTHLYFDVVSVGATINVMMAAAMADGVTIMENVAKEPHVVDVANFLNSMGANIRGAGTDVIKIRGVKTLHKSEYSIIPDQIEAGTFMFAAAATKGAVTVLNVIPKHLDATISKLIDIGCEVEEFDDAVRVVAKGRLRSTQVKTLPYPGYPTDMQPQIGVVLALAHGTSTITESIFENRFKYLDELARMGANIKIEGNSATIEGVEKFSGARVSAPDLRAGAALCIAGLATDGITIIDDIVYIQRGYERFEEKLRGLGGMIEKVASEKEIQKFTLKVS